MVLTHVESEQDVLHIAYYETSQHKEGFVDLTLSNPSDKSKLHEGDTFDIPEPDACLSGAPVTIVVHHPDGDTEEIRAQHFYSA